MILFPFYFLLFILGSAVGSFIGVIVDRLQSGEPIWKGRSHCDHCRHRLHPIDLIPLVSFLLLKRKCRYCHKSLSWYFFSIELLTALLFVFTGWSLLQHSMAFLFSPQYLLLLLYYLALDTIFLAIFFADYRYGLIPFKIVAFGLGFSIFWYLLLPSLYFTPFELNQLGVQHDFLNSLIGGLGASLFFFAIFFFTKGRGMGFGDVVFAFLMGFVLGFPKIFLALYIAFVSGAVISVILILLKKKKLKGSTIPFGPFLVAGTLVSLLWGEFIITLIRNTFMF